MNLPMPPIRQLPEPDRMLDEILREPAAVRPGRSQVVGPILVAAALILIALAVVVLRPAQPEVAGPVATPALPTAEPSRPPHSHPYQPPLKLGQSVNFGDLTVVAYAVPIRSDYEIAIRVETCVLKLPADANPAGLLLGQHLWGLGAVRTTDPIQKPLPIPTTYPDRVRLRAGECANGYLPFGVSPKAEKWQLHYADPLQNQASWTVTR